MGEDAPSGAGSRWSVLAIAGIASFCCVSLAALAGGAAVVGGATAGVTAAGGAVTTAAGLAVTAAATALPLVAVGLVLRQRARS